MFEVRFAFSTSTAQSVRTCGRPDAVEEFNTEAEALAAVKMPPKGAKMVMVRQLAPERRFVFRKAIK